MNNCSVNIGLKSPMDRKGFYMLLFIASFASSSTIPKKQFISYSLKVSTKLLQHEQYMWVCICTCMCVCVYIYIYIHTYTHTHTQASTQMQSKVENIVLKYQR
ncbi:Hypothetical predicted protein [Octopus vulgaris]|uniref:Uncharacterized protein n=1 Tax=Octopus vulgaris TaxID=6645 RepID=A0AA36BUR3_OCTVU|nr:Hypothetical predicted protein [Octopus vulgaris]